MMMVMMMKMTMMMADYHHGAKHSAGVSDRFSMRQLRSSISSAAIDAGDRFFHSLKFSQATQVSLSSNLSLAF